jgi:hypothetical protein
MSEHNLERMEAPAEPVAAAANPEHGLPESFGEGWLGRLLFWTAVSFSIFQVVTSFGVPLDRPLAAGLTLLRVIGAALVLWAVFLVVQRLRGRAVWDGAIALVAVALAAALVPLTAADCRARSCARCTSGSCASSPEPCSRTIAQARRRCAPSAGASASSASRSASITGSSTTSSSTAPATSPPST